MLTTWNYSCHSSSSNQSTCPPPTIKASMLCATIKQFTTSARWFLGNTECTGYKANMFLKLLSFCRCKNPVFPSVLRQMVWLCWFYEYEPTSRRSQGLCGTLWTTPIISRQAWTTTLDFKIISLRIAQGHTTLDLTSIDAILSKNTSRHCCFTPLLPLVIFQSDC